MSDFVSKVVIPSGVDEGTYFDLSTEHISTASFGQLTPVYCKEMVPGETIKMNMETYTRLSPLFKPAFAQISIHNKAFFVPFRTIMPKWNEFINDASCSYINASGQNVFGKIDSVPYIYASTLTVFFTNSAYGAVRSGSATDYDIQYDDDDGQGTVSTSYFKLTAYGRQCMKILNSLGYQVNTYENQAYDTTFSALPLMAFAKVYLDWYESSEYSSLSTLQSYLNRQYSYNWTPQMLSDLFDECAWIMYDQDYFTSAWDNPMAPNSGTQSLIKLDDVALSQNNSGTAPPLRNYAGYAGNQTAGGAEVGSAVVQTKTLSNVSYVSQYLLDAVKHLQDYLKRHQLVGAKAIDRFLARYGKVLPSEKLNRSNYLGANNVNIRIGDIYSTADTNGTQGAGLGSYAGAGSGYDANGNFEYSTDEFGIIVVMSTVVPKINYYQGIDYNNLHVNRLDYWTPEFDGLGSRAIRFDELYQSIITPMSSEYCDDIFGFTPRYAEYKRALGKVTGDYRVNTADTDFNHAWHLFREIDFDNGAPSDLKHSKLFCSMYEDRQQYNRIFQGYIVPGTQGTVSNNDFFNMLYLFNVADYAPMCSLYDGYDFESEGKKITATINGTQMN